MELAGVGLLLSLLSSGILPVFFENYACISALEMVTDISVM